MLTQADLPADIDTLRTLVLDHFRVLAEWEAAKDTQLAELALAKGEADAEIERLQSVFDAFMRHRFGAPSSGSILTSSSLDWRMSRRHWGKRAVRDAVSQRDCNDKPRKTNRGSPPAHLERIEQIEQIVDVDDESCPCCGGARHGSGEDVAERLDVVPTTFRVLVTLRRGLPLCRWCTRGRKPMP